MTDFSFSNIVDIYIIMLIAGGVEKNGGFNISQNFSNFSEETMLITWNMKEIFQKNNT